MQTGAVDFIQKPFRDQELLDQISEALKTDQQGRSARDRKAEVSNRAVKLTRRECEVMDLVVTGKPNKVIAYELGVSQRKVEIHRARVIDEMASRSLADLVRVHLAIYSVPSRGFLANRCTLDALAGIRICLDPFRTDSRATSRAQTIFSSVHTA